MKLTQYEQKLLEKKAINVYDKENKITVLCYPDNQIDSYINEFKLDFEFDVFQKIAQPTRKEKIGNHYEEHRVFPGFFIPRYYWDSKEI